MSKQKTCPSCQRSTSIPTKEGVALPNQRCSHCGFRLPDESQRPLLKSSDFGD
jgi:C4-type Zn-finger protein